MAMIEPLEKAQLDELFEEIDRHMAGASPRIHALWIQHRGQCRQAARHRSGARTTGTMVAAAPSAEETERARLQVQHELAEATLAAAQAGTHAQRAVDHLGTAFELERKSRRSSSSRLVALPDGEPEDP